MIGIVKLVWGPNEMPESTIECPSCGGAVPEGTTICPDCHEDLAPLVHLEYKHAILYNEALASARTGDLANAQRALEAAIQLQTGFGRAHRLLIKVLANAGRWEDANGAVERALKAVPGDPQVKKLADLVRSKQEVAELRARDTQFAEDMVKQEDKARHVATYKQDVARAFGIGAGLAAFVAFVLSRIGGRRS